MTPMYGIERVGPEAAYEYISRHFRHARDVAVTLRGGEVRVSPSNQVPDACVVIVNLISSTEVIYSVGETQVDDEFSEPTPLEALLAGVVAWATAARHGAVVEKVGWKGGEIVASKVRTVGIDDEIKASYSSMHWPFGVVWKETRYCPYEDGSDRL